MGLGQTSQQGRRDLSPLVVQGSARWSPARSTVPIGGIGRIAFLAMQIGVDPRSRLTFILLGRFMRLGPVALGVPPQARKGKAQVGRRRICAQRISKLL